MFCIRIRLLSVIRVLCSTNVCVFCILDVLRRTSGGVHITILRAGVFRSTGGIRFVVCVAACSLHFCYLSVLMVLGLE